MLYLIYRQGDKEMTTTLPRTCAECPHARLLDERRNRYVCTVAPTSNDVVHGHHEPNTDCKSRFNNLEKVKKQMEEVKDDLRSSYIVDAPDFYGNSLSTGRKQTPPYRPIIKPLADHTFLVQSEKEKAVFYRVFPIRRRCSCPAYVECKHLKRLDYAINYCGLKLVIRSRAFCEVDIFQGDTRLGKILYNNIKKVYVFSNRDGNRVNEHRDFDRLLENMVNLYANVV